MAVTLFSRLAWFGGGGEEFGLYAFALKDAGGEVLQPAVYLGILLSAAALLPLVTVFLYRRRLLQIRLCVAEMVLLVGSAVMEGIYYYLGSRVVSELSFSTHGVGIHCITRCKFAVCLVGFAGYFPGRSAGPECGPDPVNVRKFRIYMKRLLQFFANSGNNFTFEDPIGVM